MHIYVKCHYYTFIFTETVLWMQNLVFIHVLICITSTPVLLSASFILSHAMQQCQVRKTPKHSPAPHNLYVFKASFAAWHFWTFHNKSHYMKSLVILSHSWTPFHLLTCLYVEKELLLVSVRPSGVFVQETTPPRSPYQHTKQRGSYRDSIVSCQI